MAYSFSDFDARAGGVRDWLNGEYSTIRTGRATPLLLDSVAVEAYGTRVPLQQVGSVSVEDARTLRLSVWDTSQIKAVEKALQEADLGISVVTDSSGLRVIFPELTSERRVQLLKLAKSKLEDARIALRGIRDDTMKALDSAVKNSEMSEDERFRAKEELQKRVDAENHKLEALYRTKEAEIQN
jgi:ribosome recycling factor